MVTRLCKHCEAEVEVLAASETSCPVCGLDPDLPSLAFDDAAAFFLGGDPRIPMMEIAAEPAPASYR